MYFIIDILNSIVDITLQSIIFLNFFHLILGAIMKSEILILNKSICDMQKIIKRKEIVNRTNSKIEIAYLKLLIAKNQDKILSILNG